MANQAYYIAIEEQVLALDKAVGELQEVLALEVKQNGNDLLSASNYDVQGTLGVNISWLAKRLTATAKLLNDQANNANYAGVNYSVHRGEHYI